MPLHFRVSKKPMVTQETFRRLLRAVVLEAGNTVIRKVKERLKGEGWLRLYRESLTVRVEESKESATAFVYANVDKKYEEFEAGTTLAFCEGASDVATVLKAHNPWPIDVLPAVFGNPSVSLRMVPASDYEIAKRRQDIFDKQKTIKDELSKVGARLVEDGIPKYSGRVYFDFKFTALRLEYGLGPFKANPHWRRTEEEVRRSADSIVAAATRSIGGLT